MTVKEAEEICRTRIVQTMRKWRITAGMLAIKTGLPASTIIGYTREGVVPTAGRLAVICQALGIDPAWVLGLEDPEQALRGRRQV